MTQRSSYKTAVIVHTLNSLYMILGTYRALLQGPRARLPTEGIPQFVLVSAFFIGVAGLISAYGAWQDQRWGIVLTILLEVVNGLLALPGVLFGPTPYAKISAAVGVIVALFVIVTMLNSPKLTTRRTGYVWPSKDDAV